MGNRTYFAHYDENGNMTAHWIDEYDENGNRTKHTYYREDGSIRNVYDYTTGIDTDYNPDGTISGYVEHKEMENRIYRKAIYDENHNLSWYEDSENLPDGTTKTTHYDANNKPIYYTISGTDENEEWFTHIYDMNGNLLEDFPH